MSKKKNIVVLMADQMRYDYLGCYGYKNSFTPHLDSLAEEGIKFQNMYCQAPLCGPSRISFATSTYMSEHGHRQYSSCISPDVPNLVSTLRNNGYYTGMYGKNHLFTYSRLPEMWHDMDEICLGNYDKQKDYKNAYDSFTLKKGSHDDVTERLTTQGIEFIKRRKNKENPFFLWINYQDPHPAFCCPPPYDTMFDPEKVELSPAVTGYDKDRQPIKNEIFRIHSDMKNCSEQDLKRAIAHYMGQIKYVDDNVGRLVSMLKESAIIDDTIILFMSDHGELLGDYGMTHKNPTFYECLSHIPAILRHPDYTGEVYGGLTEEIDLAPTILDMLDIKSPVTMVGQSLLASIKNKTYEGKESVLVEAGLMTPTLKEPIANLHIKAPHSPTDFGTGAMIRKGSYKLSIYADDVCELYNLETDKYELNNLYGKSEYADIQAELTLLLLRRKMSAGYRDVGKRWNKKEYAVDVRRAPLERVKGANFAKQIINRIKMAKFKLKY